MEQFSFSLNMSANSFTYLNPAKHILIYFSNSITLIKSYAIQETDRTIYSINAFNNEMIIIFSQFTALFIKIKSFTHQSRCLLETIGCFYIKRNTGLRITFSYYNFIQIDKTVCSR